MAYRVVYGETLPAWERTFATRKRALAFAERQKACGDIIFSIRQVMPDEQPQSMLAALQAGVSLHDVSAGPQDRRRRTL